MRSAEDEEQRDLLERERVRAFIAEMETAPASLATAPTQAALSTSAMTRTSLPSIARNERLRVSAHTREAHDRTSEATCIPK